MCAAANIRTVYANLPYDQMHAPIVGPANPNTKNGLAAGLRNHRAGHVEVTFVFSTFLTIDLHSLRDVDLLLYQVEASADIELG